MAAPDVILRDVTAEDVHVYVRMRCDPVMMAALGGPQDEAEVRAKVVHDAAEAAADTAWILMLEVPGPTGGSTVAGSVVLWSSAGNDGPHSEIGWMVLPEHQGRGIAKAAVGLVLQRARTDGRWGPVHACPAVGNGASNGICRSLGFRLLGETPVVFAGRTLHCNDWVVDPATWDPQRGESAGAVD